MDLGLKITMLFAGMFIGLASACGSVPDGSTKVQDDNSGVGESPAFDLAPSFDACTGLLDLEDVRVASGRSDIEIKAPDVNSGATDSNGGGIRAVCLYEFITPEIFVGGPTQLRISGPSMTLTGIAFDSTESAATNYRLGLKNIQSMRESASPGSVITEGLLGDEAYLLDVNAERVGSIVGFMVGPYMVQLHTTLPDGQAPLVSPEDLLSLASTVHDQLATP